MIKKVFKKIIKRSAPTTNQSYEGNDFPAYYKSVVTEMEHIKKAFPLLEMEVYPTTMPSLIGLSGWLVSRELLDIIKDKNYDWIDSTIYVKTIFAIDFMIKGITIFDYYGLIKKDQIKDKDYHFNNDGSFCTHFGEVIKHYKHKALACLKSAESLVMEYKVYEKTGEFRLDAYPHGEILANLEYLKEKKKYEKLSRKGRI